MRQFAFTVPGRAVALQRPRINMGAIRRFKGAGRGGGPLVYTPYKCKKWQKLVQQTVQKLSLETKIPIKLLSFPISVTARFLLKRPGKISKFALRPDIDNYTKNLLDALDGVLWEDDAFVTNLQATKEFVDHAVEECTHVIVRSYD